MRALGLAVMLALTSCAALHVPPSPASVATATKLDERIGIAAETLYTGGSMAGKALVTAGTLPEARYKALDNQAYAYLLAVRAAYDAGNSASYLTAWRDLRAAVANLTGKPAA